MNLGWLVPGGGRTVRSWMWVKISISTTYGNNYIIHLFNLHGWKKFVVGHNRHSIPSWKYSAPYLFWIKPHFRNQTWTIKWTFSERRVKIEKIWLRELFIVCILNLASTGNTGIKCEFLHLSSQFNKSWNPLLWKISCPHQWTHQIFM